MQSNSAEDVPNPLLNRRLMQTKCENEIFLLYSIAANLISTVLLLQLLHFYFIWFFSSQRAKWDDLDHLLLRAEGGALLKVFY